MKENIAELENELQFRYLPHNVFESVEERLKVLDLGLAKWRSGGVTGEAVELGSRFAKEIDAAHLVPMTIGWVSDAVGHGAFAGEDLVEGAWIGEYTGVVRENDRRYLEPMNHYCYEYPVPDAIGRSYVIDATQGNLTRFINHSREPNLKPKYAFKEGMYHCIFLALRPIAKGSQLTYDYGQSYWYVREPPEGL